MRIILSLADGATYREILESWRPLHPPLACGRGATKKGIVGLGGQPQKLTPALLAKILAKTPRAPPDGSTRRSLRKMAAVVFVGKELIRKVLERYLASNDPGFEEKAAASTGLHLNPPQHAEVLRR